MNRKMVSIMQKDNSKCSVKEKDILLKIMYLADLKLSFFFFFQLFIWCVFQRCLFRSLIAECLRSLRCRLLFVYILKLNLNSWTKNEPQPHSGSVCYHIILMNYCNAEHTWFVERIVWPFTAHCNSSSYGCEWNRSRTHSQETTYFHIGKIKW